MGMKLLCCLDNKEYEYIFVFVGYGDESYVIVFELIYNWGENMYDKGNVYGYIVIEVEDIYGFCGELENQGVEVYCKFGLVKGG